MDGVDLLFLHGINRRNDAKWLVTLDAMLRAAEFPPVERSGAILLPSYSEQLDGWGLQKIEPPRANSQPKGALSGEANRDAYRKERFRIGQVLDGVGEKHVKPDPANALRGPAKALAYRTQAQQARRYLQDEHVRGSVLKRVIDELDQRQNNRVLIIAHSLGTVVALDLIRRLPPGVLVPMLVTVASPLANPEFLKVFEKENARFEFPFGVVESWVNLYNPQDHVAGGAGIQRLRPEAQDVVRKVGRNVHSLAAHLEDPTIGRVVGEALFGRATHTDAVPPPTAWLPGRAVVPTLAILYGICMRDAVRASGDQAKAKRYATALEQVRAEARSLWSGDGELEQVSSLLYREESIPDAVAEALSRQPQLLIDAALLTDLVNPIDPYEIEVPASVVRQARSDYLHKAHLATVNVEDIETAIPEAQRAFAGGLPLARKKVRPTPRGVGALGIAVRREAPAAEADGEATLATVVSIAGSGIVGSLLTSSLAAGGPDTVPTDRLGLAMAMMSSRNFQQAAVELLARALLAHKSLRQDSGALEWELLTTALTRMQEDHFQWSGISDADSDRVRDLNRKIATANKALAWLRVQRWFVGSDERMTDSDVEAAVVDDPASEAGHDLDGD